MKYINRFLIILIVLFIVIFGFILMFYPKNNKKIENNRMIDLTNKSIEEIKEYALNNKLNLEIKEEFSDKEGLEQNIKPNTKYKENDKLIITKNKINYNEYQVNELGNVPIMMYHGIHNKESKYIGGNIDKDGYQRTANAFRNDLEFYYKNNYRMIRLNDYINGDINVKLGKSPIILTFDDGLSNNIKVLGLDENNNLIVDPNSAVGILESFKEKYPDFNVTATFFINGGLFNQPEYNDKILNWLIEHNYDIANHSYTHPDFTKISEENAIKEIGSMYNLLDKYIPNKYLNIVALPFGSPYNKSHKNFKHIMKGIYNNKNYETISTLRVGWEADYSPFNKNFDKTFLKRIRAYDNNGVDFDIEMNFKILENNRYISDGNNKKITFPKKYQDKLNNIYNLEVNKY